MITSSPDPKKRIVVDYDFTFMGGTTLPITIDEEAGDTVSFEKAPLAIVITLAAKPAVTNPGVILPEEEITIFQEHLLAIQRRTREVQELTPEQKAEWDKLLNPTTSLFGVN